MSKITARLRELRDGEPVGLGGAIEVVVLLGIAAATLTVDLGPDLVAALVAASGALAGLIARWQRNNAIPYPKVRRSADDEQADRDEFVDPSEPI